MHFVSTPFGWIFSFVILALIFLLYFYNTHAHFVVPQQIFNQRKKSIYVIFKYTILVSIVLLPLDLKLITGKQLVVEKFIPIQILFDVSLSMTADDIAPSRFIAAKNATYKLIEKLDGYYISLIAFSGIPFVYIPFSHDTQIILNQRKTTNLGDFPPTLDFVGTAIGDALLLGVKNLQELHTNAGQKNGIIILITDGDSNKGYDPLQALSLLQKEHIAVFALGVGEHNYLVGYDANHNPVKTSINTDLLSKIAQDTGGEFYRVLEYQTFDKIFSAIADMVKLQEKNTIRNQYFSFNDIFLVLLCGGLSYFIIIYFLSLSKKEL